MYRTKPRKTSVFILLFLSIAVLCGGLFCLFSLDSEIELYRNANTQSIEALTAYQSDPFINSAFDAAPYEPVTDPDNALYSYRTPEGFTIISYSAPWDNDMLELLYYELKQNAHGDEIKELYEIIVYPHEDDENSALATYTPGFTTVDFYVNFPAFPDDFSINFPVFTGIINIYGGDTKTTIESIASSLSHEYGHHYTFYYMFDDEMRRQGLISSGEYARLRQAREYSLIPEISVGADYSQQRHRYLVETAAEDYVTLMGSPSTRQVEDYYDVRQYVENPELPVFKRGERNAFPQENMMIPLAIDVQGLDEYFYSFIGTQPPVPIEEKQEITIEIARQSVQYDLVTGTQSFIYYDVTWNTPYTDAIYTLACYDPYMYTGWGTPIKTVRPDYRTDRSGASAVVGEYAARTGNTVHSADDTLAQGIKVFYVIAQLPDGTYYSSGLYEFNFG